MGEGRIRRRTCAARPFAVAVRRLHVSTAPRGPGTGKRSVHPVRDDQRDEELMARAITLARAARRHTAPWPAVGCVARTRRRNRGRGCDGTVPDGPARRGRGAARGRRPRPRRDRVLHSRTVRSPRQHAAVHRQHSSKPVSPGSSWPSAIPTNGSQAGATRACGVRTSRCATASARPRPPTTSRPICITAARGGRSWWRRSR